MNKTILDIWFCLRGCFSDFFAEQNLCQIGIKSIRQITWKQSKGKDYFVVMSKLIKNRNITLDYPKLWRRKIILVLTGTKLDDITFHTVCIGFENNKLDCVNCKFVSKEKFGLKKNWGQKCVQEFVLGQPSWIRPSWIQPS